MKWITETQTPKPLKFAIKQDIFRDVATGEESFGYYLYVYENDREIYDDLQNTLEWAMAVALEDFGVPLSAWVRVE